ncbi:transferrin-binding protein-like solute binding protein [Actinobacillus equuli]|uniref:transferrin-binding protein-like solute binding protein n=1 Tax=Actinobacillus equuli TaxID=718 RepID=UPI00241814FF|nr:transferrin-binding protein-like solute binding protein [Actinobacillus equuli]MDG4953346.1 transferrin-binding protein-like solute binding protein [Actinobacillus equuli subsp. equuli]
MEKFRRHSIAIACSLFCTVALTACSSNNSGSSATKVENTAQVPKQQNAVKKEEQSTEASKKSEQPKTDNTQSKEHENTTPKVTSETKQEVSLDTHKEEQPQKVDNSQDQSNTNISHLNNEQPQTVDNNQNQDNTNVSIPNTEQQPKVDNRNPNNSNTNVSKQELPKADTNQNQSKLTVDKVKEQPIQKVDDPKKEPLLDNNGQLDPKEGKTAKKTEEPQSQIHSEKVNWGDAFVDGKPLKGGILTIKDGKAEAKAVEGTTYTSIMIDGTKLDLFPDESLEPKPYKVIKGEKLQEIVGYFGSQEDSRLGSMNWSNVRWGILETGDKLTAFVQGKPADISSQKGTYVYQDVRAVYSRNHTLYRSIDKSGSRVEADFANKNIAVVIETPYNDKIGNIPTQSINFNGKIDGNTFTAIGDGIEAKGAFYGGVGSTISGIFEGHKGTNKTLIGAFGASNRQKVDTSKLELLNKK